MTTRDCDAAETVVGERAIEDRLDSWKQIAAYLKRDVSTVQRWEKNEHLPVRRHLHGKLGSVYAFKREIDEWWGGRSIRLQFREPPPIHADPPIQAAAAIDNKGPWWIASLRRRAVLVSLVLIAGFGAAWAFSDVRTSLAPGSADPQYIRVTFDGEVHWTTVTPDGRTVAYATLGSPSRLMVRDIATGSTIELLRQKFIGVPKWSPDGSEIAVTAIPEEGRGGVAIVPRLGGQVTRIPGWYVAWAPDGKRLAVVGGSREARVEAGYGDAPDGIRIVTREGALIKAAGKPSGFRFLQGLDWSRTSDRILIRTMDDDEHHSLWTVSPQLSDFRRVYTPGASLSGATWSADGNAVYAVKSTGDSSQIVRISFSNSSAPKEEVLTPGIEAGPELSASADGRALVFTRSASVANLWRVTLNDPANATAGTATPFTRGASYLGSPSISPDARSVVFVSGKCVVRADIADSGPSQTLLSSDESVWSPTWSPDGARIGIIIKLGRTNGLWTMPSAGGAAREVRTKHRPDAWPDTVVWTADGRLAYATFDRRNFYLIDPETGEEQPLALHPEVGNLFSPRFSPDGAVAAVYWNRQSPTAAPSIPGLWTIDLRDGRETFLAANLSPLGWSPDGGAIYCMRRPYEGPEIVRVDAVTGVERVLVKFGAGSISSGSVSRDGRFLMVTITENTSDAWMIRNIDAAR
jgi:Tol biopolymer transport system component